MSDIRIQPEPAAIARIFLVLLAALAIVLVLAWLLTGGGGELFEPKSYLHAYMPDASGLLKKASVQLNGIQIGKISEVKLSGLRDPKKVIWAEMKVKTKYLPAIPVDSTVTITADDILGDKYLNIKTGERSETVREGAELKFILPLADQFDQADLMAALQDILNRVDATLKSIEDPTTPVGQFVQTEDMYNKVRSELVGFENAVQTFAHPKSDLGKMIFTDELYERIRAPLVAVDKTLADLQAGGGEYGRLLTNSEQYDKTRREIADLRNSLANINAGKGAIGEFTQSDALYRRAERLIGAIGEMVDSVNAGEGRLGAFLSDSQLYESLIGSTGELQHTVEDFRRNPRKYLRLKVF